jgi:hypothetical protein
LQSNKRKKTKNTKGRRRILDQMTSKKQMKRVTDFKCPSLEFPLSRIGEKKARDRFQYFNSKNSKIMNKGIKYEQKGVYFSGGSMSKVKGSIKNHKAAQQVKIQGLDLQKLQFLERFWARKGWRSGIRATRVL